MTGAGQLDGPTRALIALAGAIATGRTEQVAQCCDDAVARGAPAVWLDELILQSLLMLDYPRALTAAHVWRKRSGTGPASLEDGTDYARVGEWQGRGAATCRVVYGENYEKLRANVLRLHPALDAWMVVEGYGRTLSRPGLDLVRRELCVIVQVTVLGASRQLHSHLLGALNAGATAVQVDAALAVAAEYAGPDQMELARDLWQRARP